MPSPRKKPTADKAGAEPKTPARKTPRAAAKTGVEPAGVRRKRTAKAGADGAAPLVPDGSGNYDLVVVESPAKAKTINKYLGPRFKVLASYGHVRDLATGRKQAGEEVSGIKIGEGWKLRYLVDAGTKAKNRKGRRTQRDILDELKAAAAKANRVLLASDPDREGESIAWHIADELNLDPDKTWRVRFNEITRNAIQQAMAHPERIDKERVRAQEARRAMDRVVGFPLSSLLGDKVTRGLSAGRVQSVAVKLIVDREREIEAFKTEEYWKITALLTPQGSGVSWQADPKKSKVFAKKKPGEANPERERGGDAEPAADTPPEEKTGLPTPPAGSFLAELAKWDGADAALKSEADADRVVAALQGVAYVVSKMEQKDRAERPSAPFTTSTLQQQASLRLRFGVGRTMQTAQKLYEGVALGSEGTVALITYMRTDSTRVSPDALNAVRGHIQAAFGDRYLPEKPNVYTSGKSAQEAHEAVRPTDVSMTPRRVEGLGLHGDQLRLYTLIYNRFVASQMMPALFAVTNVEVTAGQGLFRATGRILKFDGYRKVMPPAGKQEDTELPPLSDGQALDKLDLFETQHFTQPPPRYNEASLVKTLEKEGIGRPSTYASIIETIQARGYVKQENRRFFATDIGKKVTDLLVEWFPKIMNPKFTSHFEEELDDIETGKCHYAEVLDEFWGPFSEALHKAQAEMPAQHGIPTGEKCPECGRDLLHLFSQKTGRQFIGCSGFKDDPACRYIKPGEGEEARPQPQVTDIPCPACGKFMVRKEGRFGTFFTCQGAPDCPTTMNLGPDGQPVVTALPTTHKCPKCGKKDLLLKQSKAGKKYVQCPDAKCKFIADADETGAPVKPAETGINCEKCGRPMVIKSSWRGPFLACTGYPACRGAKSITVELREKLKGILPPMPEKKAAAAKPDLPQVEVKERCPECGSEMRLQKSRFGGRYFLGCTKYPKCKGTAKVSPALQAQIDAAAVPAQG
ncbi:MAG TPA: type I DNA topoisomerase [Fimbriiglobus sp.]|nr:type I DNA topoisomerase [Fimbriiglobus sp.]